MSADTPAGDAETVRPPSPWLHVDGRPVAPVEVARSLRARTRGLLGRDRLEGAFLLCPAKSVHTFRMRFAIDVAFVDRDGTVRRAATMPPGRLSRLVLAARCVLEAEAGAFARWGVAEGVVVEARPLPV